MANETKRGTGGRRNFVRTRVPVVESLASAVILLALVGIGLAVYHKGKNFDPHLYSVNVAALKSTTEAVAGKAGTAPAETASATAPTPAEDATGSSGEGTSEGGAEDAHGAPAAPKVAKVPLEIKLTGIKPMGDTEFYNADNLYEKIDGRAPAYQSFNVQQLRCRSFSVTAAAGSFVDVYEYLFDSPVDAFGMFSLERDPKGQPLDFVSDGYASGLSYFFRQGPVYVQVIASDDKPATAAIAKSLAENRAKELPVHDQGLAGRRRLPVTGLVPDSIAYVPDNAQGLAALKEVFQAKYQFNGAELPFFVMVATPDEAAKAAKAFRDFCARFGTVEDLPDVAGGKIFRAQIFGKWKVIYQREGELGGVFDAADAGLARQFVEKYLRGELK